MPFSLLELVSFSDRRLSIDLRFRPKEEKVEMRRLGLVTRHVTFYKQTSTRCGAPRYQTIDLKKKNFFFSSFFPSVLIFRHLSARNAKIWTSFFGWPLDGADHSRSIRESFSFFIVAIIMMIFFLETRKKILQWADVGAGRCALLEDYNIHQNWRIAVGIHQFSVRSIHSTPRGRRSGRSIKHRFLFSPLQISSSFLPN